MHKHPRRNPAPSAKQKRSTPSSSPKRRRRRRTEAPKLCASPAVKFGEAPQDSGGFMTLLLKRMGWSEIQGLQARKHNAGRPVHDLSRGQLLVGILFHYTVTWAGTLAEHVFWLMGIQMSDGTLSERRQAVPFVVFEELLRRLLRPLQLRSPQAFFRDWLLVAIDGVRFSMPNTEQVKHCKKGRNQKGKTAFAKLQCSALVELLMHNPLAARLGFKGESEWKLAQGLLEHLPPGCLLLADRLYGCGA